MNREREKFVLFVICLESFSLIVFVEFKNPRVSYTSQRLKPEAFKIVKIFVNSSLIDVAFLMMTRCSACFPILMAFLVVDMADYRNNKIDQ